MKQLLPISLFLCASLAAQSLPTVFVGGLQISIPPPAAATELFDATVINPAGITVTHIDILNNATVGSVGTFEVYTTAVGGTSVGNQTIAAAWTLRSTQTVTVTGGRMHLVMASPFFLAAGTYGVALYYRSLNPVYTNPASATAPQPFTYANADLSFDFNQGRVRTSDPTSAFGGTAAGNTPRLANIEVFYQVGQPLVADFYADVTAGVSPLTVQFTAGAASGAPGGILVYNWDFDNNGTVDFTGQVPPPHAYACGIYSVSLQVLDANGQLTVTKTNLIVTDTVVPSFTYTLIAPNTLQFTDTTTPAASTWAWDLDGVPGVESNLQNPIFSYPTGCAEVAVTLTVTRSCRGPFTLTRRIAVAQNLTTRMDGGTITVNGATGGVNFFDLAVTNPQGVTLCGMHVHNQAAAGTPMSFEINLRPTTAMGFTTSRDGWTRVAQVSGILAAGGGQQTFVPFATPLYLPAGTYGVGLEHFGNSPRYNNTGAATVFSNADMALTSVGTQAEPTFSTGTLFSPRVPNVAFYYSTCSLSGEAGYGWFGAGCAGTLPIGTNTALSQPRIGQTCTMQITNIPGNIAFLLIGLSRTTSPLGPLPIDLGILGAPGCPARVSPDLNSLLFTPTQTATFNLNIPLNTRFICSQLFTQALIIDTPANTFGAVTSDAAAMIVGG